MTKVKVTSCPGYTFDDELLGNVYEVHDEDNSNVWIKIHHRHNSGKYAAGNIWRVSRSDVLLVPHYIPLVTPDETPVVAKVKKVKQKPKRRQQTMVYFVYNDGTSYEVRRVKHLVISAEHKAFHVDTEKNVGGLTIRQNTTVPFKVLNCVRVSTPEGDSCYYFNMDGHMESSVQEHTKDNPFKTRQF